MKKIKRKSITTGIILLFIGVSISSGISIDTKTTHVKDCGCKEVDNKHLQFLEKQLNRLEVYSKLLLVFGRYNPELKEISEEISNGTITLTMEITMDNNPIICAVLENIFMSLADFIDKLSEWNMAICILFIKTIGAPIGLTVGGIGLLLHCDWIWPDIPPWS